MQLLNKQVYRLKYCLSDYSVFLKNDQLKIFNRVMYSMIIFGNFDFFSTGRMEENTPFRNHALLRIRPSPVKSTQALLIFYMYGLLFHEKLSPPLEGPTEL